MSLGIGQISDVVGRSDPVVQHAMVWLAQYFERARGNQIAPPGDWNVWLILSGRGWGKTFAGANDCIRYCLTNPGVRYAVIAPTTNDVRKTCFEGSSGIISMVPKEVLLGGSLETGYNKSLLQIRFANGSLVEGISAERPDRLRGPQFGRAWCLTAETAVLMADGTEKPICEVKIGDLVATRKGPRKVLASGKSANPSRRLKLTVGERVLTGTADHPILTPSGWRAMGSLGEGDEICAAFFSAASLGTARISSATPWFHEDVYDLTVEDAHEFVANGVLVHNCDEAASWDSPTEMWDMLQFALRLGKHPQVICTTTPKPIKLLRSLLSRVGKDVLLTRGSTFENKDNLAASALESMRERYEGTRIGRQELHGELLEDVDGALWNFEMIRRCKEVGDLEQVVVAVDPSGSTNGDPVGIVAVGRKDKSFYVLEDASMRGSPREWARRAIRLYDQPDILADRLVAERNFGGDMVGNVMKQEAEHLYRIGQRDQPDISYRDVVASRGKIVRAEPVAALYEQGRVFHVGEFGDLEDEMTRFKPDWDRARDGSPNRVDALVFGIEELRGRMLRSGSMVGGRV